VKRSNCITSCRREVGVNPEFFAPVLNAIRNTRGCKCTCPWSTSRGGCLLLFQRSSEQKTQAARSIFSGKCGGCNKRNVHIPGCNDAEQADSESFRRAAKQGRKTKGQPSNSPDSGLCHASGVTLICDLRMVLGFSGCVRRHRGGGGTSARLKIS
jgi:hypothetical protein